VSRSTEVVVLCRVIVALTFVLSGVWKLQNRPAFIAVVMSSSGRWRGARVSALGPSIAAFELLIALLLLTGFAAVVGAAAAGFFLIAFSIFLARADSLANGCGCWRPPQQSREELAPYLVRNLILVGLTVVGVAGTPGHVAVGLRFVLIGTALIPAVMIMEIPTIVSVVRQGPPLGARETKQEL
jgi:uncharacterized membrane protein YphA (DoxX/SURF4 family)